MSIKVLQQVDVHLIVPILFQRIVNEKLIYNTNRFVLQELGILLGGCLTWRYLIEHLDRNETNYFMYR